MNVSTQVSPWCGQVLGGGLAVNDLMPQHTVVGDSRLVTPGAVCVVATEDPKRAHSSGVDALRRGARAVVYDRLLADGSRLVSPHARWMAARLARAQVTTHPPLVAVTGTDGKTSVVWWVWQAWGAASGGAARCGTLGFHTGIHNIPGSLTTPSPQQWADFLQQLPAACPVVACELSSHAINQHRLAGYAFDSLVITGIGSDHLDYHRSHADYVATKLAACALLKPGGLCVYNADDSRASSIRHRAGLSGARCVGIGYEQGDYRIDGQSLRVVTGDEVMPLPAGPSGFRRWNQAAALVVAAAGGLDVHLVCARLQHAPDVPGRMQQVTDAPVSIVDFAHTPGAVQQAIAAVRAQFPGARVVVVCGCGGDRDRSKRPLMAQAAMAADVCWFTSDNPRHEDPDSIIDEMMVGLDAQQRARVQRCDDREAALCAAWNSLERDTVLLVCGKGHEQTQQIGDRFMPWDDVQALRRLAAAEVSS